MARYPFSVIAALLALAASTDAWSPSSSSAHISRRDALRSVAVVGTTAAFVPAPAFAGGAGEDEPRVTSRMGGLLEPFQDGGRGLRMMAPSGWNKFDGEVGAYDLKWQDLVDPTENIKISSSPVKSTTESVEALGPVKDVGERLAARRSAKLMNASQRTTEGVVFYTFDFALNDGTHQLLLLCVCKNKLWSVDASAKERRWSKREELYKNVLGSFVPRLNPV